MRPNLNTDILNVTRADDLLPQTASTDYFLISGSDAGKAAVEILQIIGVVGTTIEAVTNFTKIEHEFSGDLTATLDISGDTSAGNYFISQDPATAMKDVTGGVPNFVSVCLVPGNIKLNCGGSATGSTSWVVYYRKLQPDATITAV